MKKVSTDIKAYRKTLKRRIWLLALSCILIVAYTVIMTELGGGDSRHIPPMVISYGSAILLGGLAYMIGKIIHYSSVLKDKGLLRENMFREKDEYREYLHEKTGGDVWTVSWVLGLIALVTFSAFYPEMFYGAAAVLTCMAVTKAGFYLYFRFIHRVG